MLKSLATQALLRPRADAVSDANEGAPHSRWFLVSRQQATVRAQHQTFRRVPSKRLAPRTHAALLSPARRRVPAGARRLALATAMGLATVALDLPVTSAEAGAGLVPPAIAAHLMGKGGAVAITIMLFMAIVSTGSAESIATSSLVAYDIYRKYFNPKASGEDFRLHGVTGRPARW